MVDATLFKSEKKYLSAKEDFELNGKTATIDAVFEEEISNNSGEVKESLCIRFKGIKKVLSLNQTNLALCIDKWGKDTDKWINEKVSFTMVTTTMGKGIQIIPQ